MSHCPTILGPGELPTPNFPGAGGTILTPSGSKRGIVVLMHGINDGFPPLLADITFFVTLYYLTLAQNLEADGWMVVWAQEIGDSYVTTQSDGWWNDCNQDSGNGSRILANIERFVDHAVDWCNSVLPGAPIVFGGVSLGGFHALQIAIHKTAKIAGYFCQVPATLIWSAQVDPSFDVDPTTWALDSSMNGLTLPQSTIKANAAIGTPPAGTSGCIVVATGGVSQIVRYTGVSGQNFTGCTGGDGTSVMATGGQISQSDFTSGMDVSMTALNALGNGSQGAPPKGYLCYETGDISAGYANTEQLGANAVNAGAPVTVHAVSGGGHSLTQADVGFLVAKNWVSGGTYAVNQMVISSGASYVCIVAVSGSTTAPASDGTHWSAISAGPTSQGWFPTVLDPICPASH